MESSKDFRIVYCNTDDFATAMQIASKLISGKLAACCSISKDTNSLYFWEGKLVEGIEFTLMIKTHFSKLEKLEAVILDNHNYDVPEIITVELRESTEKYLDWMKTEMDIND